MPWNLTEPCLLQVDHSTTKQVSQLSMAITYNKIQQYLRYHLPVETIEIFSFLLCTVFVQNKWTVFPIPTSSWSVNGQQIRQYLSTPVAYSSVNHVNQQSLARTCNKMQKQSQLVATNSIVIILLVVFFVENVWSAYQTLSKGSSTAI